MSCSDALYRINLSLRRPEPTPIISDVLFLLKTRSEPSDAWILESLCVDHKFGIIMNFVQAITSISLLVHFTGAFAPLAYNNVRTKQTLVRVQDYEQDFFEAEEAAMFDAFDLSDSGMEAAVMER